MKKNMCLLFSFLFCFILTGCSNNTESTEINIETFDMSDTCWELKTIKENSKNNYYCFDKSKYKAYFVKKVDNEYIGYYTDELAWKETNNLKGFISYKSTMRTKDNTNSYTDYKYEYSVTKENKEVQLYMDYQDNLIDNDIFILSDVKLNDVHLMEKNIPVEFLGEKSTYSPSNIFDTLIFKTNINFEENTKNSFVLGTTKIHYLDNETLSKINATKDLTMLEALLSKYTLCYETDFGIDYVENVTQVPDNITFLKIDYCTNYKKDVSVDTKEVYELIAGQCFWSDGSGNWDQFCLSKNLKYAYYIEPSEMGKVTKFKLTNDNGIYKFNNKEVFLAENKKGSRIKVSYGDINFLNYGSIEDYVDYGIDPNEG